MTLDHEFFTWSRATGTIVRGGKALMASPSKSSGANHRARGGTRAHNSKAQTGPPHADAPQSSRGVCVAHRLWLEQDGERIFGPGTYELLWRVEQTGSLSRASKDMSMAYSKAWRIMREVEKRLGVALFERTTGGPNGGGSTLTDEARSLLARYSALQRDADKLLGDLFAKHFAGTSYATAKEPSASLRRPARHGKSP